MTKFFLIDDHDDDRRKQPDRRINFAPTTFPVYTRQGNWIRKECRKTPERRIKNIDVKESYISNEQFKELFDANSGE